MAEKAVLFTTEEIGFIMSALQEAKRLRSIKMQDFDKYDHVLLQLSNLHAQAIMTDKLNPSKEESTASLGFVCCDTGMRSNGKEHDSNCPSKLESIAVQPLEKILNPTILSEPVPPIAALGTWILRNRAIAIVTGLIDFVDLKTRKLRKLYTGYILSSKEQPTKLIRFDNGLWNEGGNSFDGYMEYDLFERVREKN